jgi:hypothetical protein
VPPYILLFPVTPKNVVLEKKGLRQFLVSAAGHRWWSSFIGLQVILASIACGLSVISDVLSHNMYEFKTVIYLQPFGHWGSHVL